MMDSRSEAMLIGVHPDLVKVMRAALQIPQAFIITYGVRTIAAEKIAVATGHSQTMHSRHLPQVGQHGYACAVDVDDAVNGHADPMFARGCEEAVFGAIAKQILDAAHGLNTAVQWGGQEVGAWTDGVVSHFRDWGHFQLDPSAYP
jgi:peptidoglycan L-alanyl-D-glutamate endopeptidase CwlK